MFTFAANAPRSLDIILFELLFLSWVLLELMWWFCDLCWCWCDIIDIDHQKHNPNSIDNLACTQSSIYMLCRFSNPSLMSMFRRRSIWQVSFKCLCRFSFSTKHSSPKAFVNASSNTSSEKKVEQHSWSGSALKTSSAAESKLALIKT